MDTARQTMVRARLQLELEPDQMSGVIETEDASPQEFSGWLELVAIVERLRPSAADPPAS